MLRKLSVAFAAFALATTSALAANPQVEFDTTGDVITLDCIPTRRRRPSRTSSRT